MLLKHSEKSTLRMANKINAYTNIVKSNDNWSKLSNQQRKTIKRGGKIHIVADPYKEELEYLQNMIYYIDHLKKRIKPN